VVKGGCAGFSRSTVTSTTQEGNPTLACGARIHKVKHEMVLRAGAYVKNSHHNRPARPGQAHRRCANTKLLPSEFQSGALRRSALWNSYRVVRSPQGEERCEPAMRAPAPAPVPGAVLPLGHGGSPGRRSRRSCGRRRRTTATQPTSRRHAATRSGTSSVREHSPVCLKLASPSGIDCDLRCFAL